MHAFRRFTQRLHFLEIGIERGTVDHLNKHLPTLLLGALAFYWHKPRDSLLQHRVVIGALEFY